MKITVHNDVDEACTFEEMHYAKQYRKMDYEGVVDLESVWVKFDLVKIAVLVKFDTDKDSPRLWSGDTVCKHFSSFRFVPLRKPVTVQFTMPAWSD
jgi:hypothetical protein